MVVRRACSFVFLIVLAVVAAKAARAFDCRGFDGTVCAGEPITWVDVEQLAGGECAGAPITFGQVFKRGDVPAGFMLAHQWVFEEGADCPRLNLFLQPPAGYLECASDLNADGRVNFRDLGIIAIALFRDDAGADINDDSVVDLSDLGILRSVFFKLCPIDRPSRPLSPDKSPPVVAIASG